MEGSTQSRRTWSRREEDALILSLRELVTNGWRADNSFKPGYVGALEKLLAVRCPGSDLNQRNINSKLTVWKKRYAILIGILGTSGIGWDDKAKKILVDGDDVWDNYVRGKKTAFETIYEDMPDFVNLATDGDEDPCITPVGRLNVPPKMMGPKSKSLVGRKRKSGESSRDDNIYLDRFINSAESTFSTLLTKFDKEENSSIPPTPSPPQPSTLAKQVYENVVKFNIEPADTRFFVITKIGSNPYYTDLFLSMPENDQANFLQSIIGGKVP
ncbi:hypothetical protein ACJIZ3_000044 [Penstemon smallii]|uniref:Myb/SANT-like domain-containing protein n=1 Tax=Penstemon smallii TaxID=265156 RepID=A0ABD3RF71_9LAMI